MVGRARAFYRRTEPGHFLVNVSVPAEAPAVPPLSDFDLDAQLAEWMAARLEAARPGWRAKAGLDDDGIPAICPAFGIAEHSAWLGAEVLLQETTCLPVPVIRTADDLARLRPSEETRWFRYMRDGYRYLRGRQDGTFVLSVRGSMAPMDMANALRGDDLFTDFLLEPAFCHALLDRLVEVTKWYFEHLLSWATDIEGGRVYTYGGTWMPPRTLGHLSNDAAMLCSPEVYDEFGFPYESRLAAAYDRILFHVHNQKMHFVPQLAGLPGLAMLDVTHDPKTAPPMEDLDRVLAATGSANLMLQADSDQVRSHIDGLSSRNVLLLVACRDRSDAEDVVALVRDRSKPL